MSDFKAKCTKFNFGWVSALDPAEELPALPRLLAVLKGPTSKGRERGEGYRGGKGEEKRETRILS